jgi:probable O-glycosylation ligase (exosortase A-associated)
MAIEIALRARSRVGQVAAWIAVVALLMAVIGTQSRGGTLALCAIAGYLWLTSKRKGAMSLTIGAVVLLAALFASDAYLSRMGTIKNYQMDSSAGARVTAWKSATWMARDNPVFGVGAGHFPTAYGTRYLPPDADSDRMMTAHSMYFLVLGELGVPGIVTLVALVFGGVRAILAMRRRILKCATDPPSDQSRRFARMLSHLAASGIGFAVAGAFLSVAYYPHVFVLTAILVSARAIVTSVLDADGPKSVAAEPNAAAESGASGFRRRKPAGRRPLRAQIGANGQ